MAEIYVLIQMQLNVVVFVFDKMNTISPWQNKQSNQNASHHISTQNELQTSGAQPSNLAVSVGGTYQAAPCRQARSSVTTCRPSLRKGQASTATFMSSSSRTDPSTSRGTPGLRRGEQCSNIVPCCKECTHLQPQQ